MTNSTQKNWYDKTWLVIILCIVFFPVGLYGLWKNNSVSKGWKIGVTVIIALLILANIGNEKEKGNVLKANASSENNTSNPEPVKKENWYYNEDQDKMDNTKRYFARCTSTNQIEFEFPYNGGSDFTLMVRQMGQNSEVLLSVSKGQFMTSIGESESVRIKFDDGAPMTVSYNSAADGSHDIIFLNSSKKVISNLKKSKKVLIEAPFFNAGRQHIEFDVEGLKWDK